MYFNLELYEISNKIEDFLYEEILLYENLNLTFNVCKHRMLENVKYILENIQKEYSNNHPFKNPNFIYGPVLYQLAYVKLICEDYLNNKNIMEDYLNKKLLSNEKSKFNLDIFNRNMSEYVFFEYVLMGFYIKSDLYKEIVRLNYEPIQVNNKKLEYSFVLKAGYSINIEVKTIDCDPFLKDYELMNKIDLSKKNLYIKKFFKDIDVKEELENIIGENQKYFELTSNYRQVNKNLNKIKKKFENTTPNDINMGVIVISYGTSREEFFSYLLHKEKGTLIKHTLGNIDNLILFSNTHYSSFTLDEIYKTKHIFSINMNLNYYKRNIFEKLRLDNYIIKDGICQEEFFPFQEDVVGVYTSEIIDNYFTLLPYFVDYNERKKHLKKINAENEGVFNYDIGVCSKHGLIMDR